MTDLGKTMLFRIVKAGQYLAVKYDVFSVRLHNRCPYDVVVKVERYEPTKKEN